MPQGLEVYGASGETFISVTDRLGRYLGVLSLTSGSGSVSVPGFGSGTPFFTLIANPTTLSYAPEVWISGTTLYWSYVPLASNTSLGSSGGGQTPCPCTLIYGVY